MEEVVSWMLPVVIVGGIVNILIFVVYSGNVSLKQARRFGVRAYSCSEEDSEEATKMLVDFLSDSLQADERVYKETEVGCDSLFVLRGSKDISRLIKVVHLMGGRLVLRKKLDGDIECIGNGKDDVRKRLTELDIERSKRINNEIRK